MYFVIVVYAVEKDMVKAGLRRDDAQVKVAWQCAWGIWLFVIGRRTLTSDLRENGIKTLVCVVYAVYSKNI
jgi:hypothetical protein